MSGPSDVRDASDEDQRRRDRLEKILDQIERIEDRHQDWYLQSERDFQSIFRFNIVILGGFLSAFGYLVEGLEIAVPPAAVLDIGIAFAFWVMSTFSVALSYIGIYARVGIDHVFESQMTTKDDEEVPVDDLISTDMLQVETEADYYEEVLVAYLRTLAHNNTESSNFRYALYHASILLLVDALVVFALTVPSLGNGPLPSLPPTVSGVVFVSKSFAILFGLALSVGVLWNCYLFRDRIWWKVRAFWEKETGRMPMETVDRNE